jgi:hypothetical protein
MRDLMTKNLAGGQLFINSADAAALPPTCVMPQRWKNTDSPVKGIGFVVQWGGGGWGRGKAQDLGDFGNGEGIGPSSDVFFRFSGKVFFLSYHGVQRILKKMCGNLTCWTP